MLDRLQITIAPIIIGSGRPGLSLPGGGTIERCARPPQRRFTLGDDVLWEFDVGAAGPSAPGDDVLVPDTQG